MMVRGDVTWDEANRFLHHTCAVFEREVADRIYDAVQPVRSNQRSSPHDLVVAVLEAVRGLDL